MGIVATTVFVAVVDHRDGVGFTNRDIGEEVCQWHLDVAVLEDL